MKKKKRKSTSKQPAPKTANMVPFAFTFPTTEGEEVFVLRLEPVEKEETCPSPPKLKSAKRSRK